MVMHTIEAHFEVKANTLTSREDRIAARAVELITQAVGCERKLVEDVLKIFSIFNGAMAQAASEVDG